jgi:hypothetical protein
MSTDEAATFPVSVSQGHAFTEARRKQPGFEYLQPTELVLVPINLHTTLCIIHLLPRDNTESAC